MPTKGPTDSTSKQVLDAKNMVEVMKKSEIGGANKPAVIGKSDVQSTVNISLQEDFMCSPEDLYRVFVTDEVNSAIFSLI